MPARPWPPEDVLAYYDADVEDGRLEAGEGRLEFERTKELLGRLLPPASAVADVGGGSGRYAEWLDAAGHAVELVDPVPLHCRLARARAGEPPRFGVRVGDARALPFAAESFDAVLLLGPLYHLGDRDDRLAAVREAARVCRPGGLVVAAAISRLAPLLDSVRAGRIAGPTFPNVQVETLGGRRVPPERRGAPFPDAYFHRPQELADELAAAGLDVRGVYGVEGPARFVADLDAAWAEPVVRARILWAARALERDSDAIAMSAHLLAVAAKPGAPPATVAA